LGCSSPNSYSIREERTTQIHSLKEKCIKVNVLANSLSSGRRKGLQYN